MPKIFQMNSLPCLGDTIMMVEVKALPPPPPKSFDEWKAPWILSLREDRIHCPGCVDQERKAHEWLSNILDIKSNRTPQEEQELKLHRQKLGFLNNVYDIVCKTYAMKQQIKLDLRIAANRLQKDSFIPAMTVVATVAPTVAPTAAAIGASVCVSAIGA
jgi:hypothetical protein